MKKWVFILFIACTICVGVYISPLFQKEIDVKIGGENSAVKAGNMEKVEITKKKFIKGLLLVNKDYSKKIVLGPIL